MATYITVCETEKEWADLAADEICRILAQVPEISQALVALAGGATPRPVYERLACKPWRERIPWKRIIWCWGDERWIGPEHVQSNYRLARDAFLVATEADPQRIKPIRTWDISLTDSACEYEKNWRTWLSEPQRFVFALAILGVGTDGHTASLFPGSAALSEKERWVIPVRSQQAPFDRISMTLPLLNQAQDVLVLAKGTEKNAVLKRVANGQPDIFGVPYPISRVRPEKNSYWVVDRAAMEGIGHFDTNTVE